MISSTEKLVHSVALSLAMLTTTLLASGSNSSTTVPVELRGSRVAWARLITPGSLWYQHQKNDPYIADFIRRKVGFAMDSTPATVDPTNLDQLCSYPLIFVNNLESLQDRRERDNLGEYLRRGGFLFIDPCILPRMTPHPEAYVRHHRDIVTSLLPDCVMRTLGPEHDIFRCYFLMQNRPPVDERVRNEQYPGWDGLGLYGFYVGDRMVAVLSMVNLQCGWGNRCQG